MEFGKILVFVVTVFIGISNTIRIGAFNLKIYGPKKSKDVTVMSYIVKVNNLTLGSSHFNTYLRLKLKEKTCSLFTHNLIFFFFWKYYFSLFSLCCRASLKMYFGQRFHTPMKLQKNVFNS